MIQWIIDNIETPLFIAIGAVCMKFVDKFLSRKKAKKELTAQDIENSGNSIANFERLNNLLGKQLEVNVQRYLDILNSNITLKGDNAALREQVQDMKCELKKLRSQVADFEIEIQKLKKYVIDNNIKTK